MSVTNIVKSTRIQILGKRYMQVYHMRVLCGIHAHGKQACSVYLPRELYCNLANNNCISTIFWFSISNITIIVYIP